MIYLIKDRDYLKIGYSSNIDQRKKAYDTTNCYAKMIMIKDGSRKDETILHKLCEQWHYKNEWFYYNDEIIKIFEEYQSDNNEERIQKLEKEVCGLKTQLQSLISHIKERDKEWENYNKEWDILNKEFISGLNILKFS